jgi:hypothetical protein
VPEVTTERAELIAMYEAGPERLKTALATVPPEAMKWRPAEGEWSAHEIIVHCADSESNAALRIRYLAAEPEPLIIGYDQENWARVLDYHSHPLEPALRTIEAVRANTVPLLRRLPESAWQKVGRHTEAGTYGAEKWLRIYAAHLEEHAAQIEANVAAWQARQ